jgi:uncharacterized protein YqgV (UPF0045/DUF77 family)
MAPGYAYKVNRVSIFGTSYSGAEEWSTGFFLGNLDSDVATPNEAQCQAVKDAWETFFEANGNSIPYLWKTTGVKIAHIKLDGKTDLDNVATSYYTPEIVGPNAGTGFPPQISVVATLLAGNGKGLGGKGRMYLPGIALGIDGTGHFPPGSNQGVADRLAAMFNTIEASFDIAGQVINASQGRDTGLFEGKVNRAVTHIRVGNVYDTQRRRRNQLVESYATAALA